MKLIKRVLVLGATGYVGSRLVPRLLDEGYSVRAGYRTRSKIECMSWSEHPNLELAKIDVLDLESLENGCKDCDAVYYLVHSMYQGKRFADLDLQGAENMVKAADKADVKQIIYLGGLGENVKNLSEHLSSRAKVSNILHRGPVPVTTLRAAMIIGAGSTSFEILRYLVERLPIMTAPKWLRTKSQPIAISNVLNYLVGCLDNPETKERVLDIGGPEILSYTNLMGLYLKESKISRRLIAPIPLLTPNLSSYWVALITPISSSIVRPLIGGLKNEAICLNDDITRIIPQKLITNKQAIRLALNQVHHWFTKPYHVEMYNPNIPEWTHTCDPAWAGGDTNTLHESITINAPVEMVWKSLQRIIGSEGWNYGSWFWLVRGRLDELLGGNGMKWSLDNRSQMKPESVIDCWDVIDVIEEKYLKLRLKMHLPAKVSLEFALYSSEQKSSDVHLRLSYSPKGFRGFMIWYGLLPFRRPVLKKLLRRVREITSQT